MICSLALLSLASFTIGLALGFGRVSLCKMWKPISNLAVLTQSYPNGLSDFTQQVDHNNFLRVDANGMPLGLLKQILRNMLQAHSGQGLSSILSTRAENFPARPLEPEPRLFGKGL